MEKRRLFDSTNSKIKKVYDIINVTPHHSFTVMDENGIPLIVHNCNGAIYTGDSGNWAHIHDAKMDALEEIIEENAGENILISYTYRHDLARLQKRFPTARLLDAKGAIIDEWNKGKVPLLLAHPASCGHGINLQGGGAMLIWFGLSWNLEHDLQMNARLHRQGQKRPVRIVRIVTKGTIDERVLGVLDNKNRTQNDLLRALKAEM
jgi:SNF2 family DNA or RNA helicase